VALAAPAFAADLGGKSTPPSTVADFTGIKLVANQWTGFYLGAFGGFGAISVAHGAEESDFDISASNFMLEGRAGYDQQTTISVFGIYGDVNWLNARFGGTNEGSGDVKANLSYDLNLRYGIPIGNVMPYVAVGGVWQDFTGDLNPSGYRAAGGLEFRWTDHLSLTTEISGNWASDNGSDANTYVGLAGLSYRF